MEEKSFSLIIHAESGVKEFTLRAVLLGVLMAAFMGAANALLGLKAGMTIAATYTTAVVGTAVIIILPSFLRVPQNRSRAGGSGVSERFGYYVRRKSRISLHRFFYRKFFHSSSPFFTSTSDLLKYPSYPIAGNTT